MSEITKEESGKQIIENILAIIKKEREDISGITHLNDTCKQINEDIYMSKLSKPAQRILELGTAWMKYIGGSHHKDRDCHFNIEIQYSYGTDILYFPYHKGYIYQSKNWESYETLEEAEEALIEIILDAFRDQIEWTDKIKASPKDWGEDQIEMVDKAEKYLKPYLTN